MNSLEKFEQLNEGLSDLINKMKNKFFGGSNDNPQPVQNKPLSRSEKVDDEKANPNAYKRSINGNIIEDEGDNIYIFHINKDDKYIIDYDSTTDELGINWLFNKSNKFHADYIDFDETTKKLLFKGVWEAGNFKGIMLPGSKINGGKMVDAIYKSENENYNIGIKDFINSKWLGTGNGVFKKPFVEPNKENEKVEIFRVKKGDTIKLTFDNNKYTAYKVDKTIDYSGSDIVLRNLYTKQILEIPFISLQKIPDFYILTKGFTYDLGEGFKTESPVKKLIVVSDYEVQSKPVIKKYLPLILSYTDFAFKTNLKPENDTDREKYNIFIEEIKSGKFLQTLNQIKDSIKNQEIDGFGEFPTAKYLFSTKGEWSKTTSKEAGFSERKKELEKLMQYIVDIKRFIIDKIVNDKGLPSDVLKNKFIDLFKKYINVNNITSSQPAGNNNNASLDKFLVKEDYKLSIVDVVKKSLE